MQRAVWLSRVQRGLVRYGDGPQRMFMNEGCRVSDPDPYPDPDPHGSALV